MKKRFFACVLAILCIGVARAQTPATLSGRINNARFDSISVSLLEENVPRRLRTLKVPVVKDSFYISIALPRPTIVSVIYGETYVNGILEKGDRVNIRMDAAKPAEKPQLSGRGKEKFLFFQLLAENSLSRQVGGLKVNTAWALQQSSPVDAQIQYVDSCEKILRNKLLEIKKHISPAVYLLLEGELAGNYLMRKHYAVGMLYNEPMNTVLADTSRQWTPTARKFLQKPYEFDDQYAGSSTYLYQVRGVLSALYNEQATVYKMDAAQKYRYLAAVLPGKLKAPVLALFLYGDAETINDKETFEGLVKQIYQNPAENKYKKYLLERYEQAHALKNGMKAPDFSVEDEQGQLVTLDSFAGKLVFLDFWFAACGPCHALFEELAPVKEHFKDNANVVFLTVSIDDKKPWKEALEKYKLRGRHVFTQNQGRDHAMISDYRVSGYPTTYLIGPDGRFIDIAPPHNAALLIRQLEKALP